MMQHGAAPGPLRARRGRPPKGTEQLSRAAIVDAALRLIDEKGIAGVSMRAVAAALDVDPKSLYNHVGGRDGLLDAVAEEVLGSLELPDPTGDADADLRAIAHVFREGTLARPEAGALVLTRQIESLRSLAPVEAVLTVLREAGCRPDEAVHLLRVFVALIVGSLLREVNAGPTFGSVDPQVIAQRETALRSSGLTAVADAAPHLARFDPKVEFDGAVDFALDVLKVRLASRDVT